MESFSVQTLKLRRNRQMCTLWKDTALCRHENIVLQYLHRTHQAAAAKAFSQAPNLYPALLSCNSI